MSRTVAGRAISWSAAEIISRQLIQFGVTLILARLVAPADFGTVAIILFFSAFGTSVLSGAALVAVTRRAEPDRVEESVVFWWLMLASAVLSVALIALSPAMARFYALPDLQPLGWLAAAQVMVTAFGTVPTAILTRALRFRAMAIVGLVGNAIAGIVGVAMALAGYGVFALAAQVLLAALVPALVHWPLARWTPTLAFRPKRAATTFGIIGWQVPTNLLGVTAAQGYSLIVGRLDGATALGLYGRAANLAQIPQNIFMQVVGRVALPLFAARAEDDTAIRAGLLEANRVAMLFYTPLMLGLAACSSSIVSLLFGERWLPAAPLLAILALAGLLYPLKSLNQNVLLATGRARQVFMVEMSERSVAVVCTVAGSFLGLAALAWSQVVAAIIGLILTGRASRMAIGLGMGTQLRDVTTVLLAGAVMALAANRLDAALTMPLMPRLAIVIVAAALVYLLALIVLRVPALHDLRHFAAGMRRGELATPHGGT